MQTSSIEKYKEYISPFPSECLDKIKNLFTLIIFKQNENSLLKNQLFSYENFSPEIFFQKLDYFSKNNITTLDLLHYLEQHQFKFNDEIIRRFIKQYDKHGNFNLCFEDFLNIIIPFDKNNDTNNQDYFDNNMNYANTNFDELDEIFCMIMINELKLIGLIGDEIMKLRKINNFDSYQIFEEISKGNKFINGEILFFFLEGKFNTMEIKRLVYFLDRNNDGLISFDDFHDLLIPIKSDFESNDNDYQYNNTYEGKINQSFDNNIYLNEQEKFSHFRSTYYTDYDIKTRNINFNSKILNKRRFNKNLNSKKLILNKYINHSEPIHEQNEINEKESEPNENLENHYHLNENINENESKNEIKDDNGDENDSAFEQKNLNESKKPDLQNVSMNNKEISEDQSQISKEENNKDFQNKKYININEKNLEKNEENNIKEKDLNNDLSEEKIEKSQSLSMKNEINDFEKNKENINYNIVDLQKFPVTFGKNQENESNSNKEVINFNEDNSLNNKEDDINNKSNSNKKNRQKKILNNCINKSKKKSTSSSPDINNIHFNEDITNNNQEFSVKSKLEYESNDNINMINTNSYCSHLNEDDISNVNNKFNNVLENKDINLPNMIDTISIFFEYIRLIIYYENKLEHLKESLSLRDDLSIIEIFYLFDKDKSKYITICNFELICKKVFKVFPTKDQITLLFKRYKRDLNLNSKNIQDFSLRQDEFMNMLIPKKNDYISSTSNKNKSDKTKSKLSKKSKNILIELIKCLIIKESDYYKIRCQLEQNDLEFIWQEIHKYSKDDISIGKKELNRFLEEYGYILGEKQIEIIFNIFDKDKKGLITDNDFFEEMCCE